MERIGIYPGTFDPVHNGHIAFALAAKKACQLDKVVFLPETYPRGKENVTKIDNRLEGIRQALTEFADLEVTLAKSSPFTVKDTLAELRLEFPDAVFTLLVGSDVYRGLPNWPDVSQLIKQVGIAVGCRRNDTMESLKAIKLPHLTITFIPLPGTDHLSSKMTKAD